MLAPSGPLRPTPRDTWSESSRRLLRDLPAELLELLERAGPGALGGVFATPDPLGDGFAELRERFSRAVAQGAWPGLSPADLSRVVPFATDGRGSALAWLAHRYVLLEARGATVLDGWRSLGELALGLFASLHFIFDTRAPGQRDRFVELSAEPTWVTAGARGLRDFLAALRVGDASLEDALHARPFPLAVLEALSALCGPRGDDVPRERRADVVDTLVALTRRSAPLVLEHVLPRQLARGFDAPESRAWAARPSAATLGPRGPLALVQGEELELERWLPSAIERARGTSWEQAIGPLVDRATALPRRERVRVLWLLEELDDLRARPRLGNAGAALPVADPRARAQPGNGCALRLEEPAERFERADRAEALLRATLPAAAPLIQLATMLGSERERVRATRLLVGVPGLDAHWLLLAATTPLPAPWGADPLTFAARCLHPDDAQVDALLPALQVGSPLAALALRGAAARPDVCAALLEVFDEVSTEGDWLPPAATRAHVFAPDEIGTAALRAWLGVEPVAAALDAPPTESGLQPPACFVENGLRTEPRPSAPHALSAPFRPGAPGPIMRALATCGDARVPAALVRLARSSRTPLAARDEAVAGLELLGDPGAAALRAAVDDAWAKHWRL